MQGFEIRYVWPIWWKQFISRVRQQRPRAVPGVRRQGLGLPLRRAQLRGLQGRNRKISRRVVDSSNPHQHPHNNNQQHNCSHIIPACAVELLSEAAVECSYSSNQMFLHRSDHEISWPPPAQHATTVLLLLSVLFLLRKLNLPHQEMFRFEIRMDGKLELGRIPPQFCCIQMSPMCESKWKQF